MSEPPTSEFDTEIAVTPTQAGEYAGRLTDRWRIGNGVNGGVVMSLAASAMAHRLESEGAHAELLAFSGYFLTASEPGPVILSTEVIRAGRTISTGQASVSQQAADGQVVERMRALASFGDLPDAPERAAPPPDLPPPEGCVSGREGISFLRAASLLERFELRLDPATLGWLEGNPSRRGLLQGWLRMVDDRAPDPLLLLFALDALPPVAFDLGLFGWTPTLELTAQIVARPVPGWLRVAVTSGPVGGGRMVEDAQVWDSAGTLVGQSRQLCGLPRQAG